jgi:hypothetical protein
MCKFLLLCLFILCSQINAANDASYRKPTISFNPVSGRNFICYYSSEKTLEITNTKEKKMVSVAMPDRVASMVSAKDCIVVFTLDGKIIVVDEKGGIICRDEINGLIISSVSLNRHQNMHFAILVSVEDGKIEEELKSQVWYGTVKDGKIDYIKSPENFTFGSLSYYLKTLWFTNDKIAKKIPFPK